MSTGLSPHKYIKTIYQALDADSQHRYAKIMGLFTHSNDMSNREIEIQLGMAQDYLSQDLAVLRKVKLMGWTRQGQSISNYALPKQIKKAKELLADIKNLI